MSEPTTKELSVTIQTEGALLTLTPRGLLDYYLPNAKEVEGRPGVWKGKSSTGKDVYIQTEVLAGALLDCKEKQLNPVTEIYLIPSNSPDRKASHKLKYTVGLERMRELPGFLGLNSGLILIKGEELKRSQGRMLYPGWDCFGAWAKAYFVGMPEPIEHEVDFASCVVDHSPVWQERPGFMLLKVVEDELWRLKVLPRMKPAQREAIDGEAIILEGRPLREVAKEEEPKHDTKAADTPHPFQPGELYQGTILTITGPSVTKKHGKQQKLPGLVTLATPWGKLTCLYWSPPPALVPPASWPSLIGNDAAMSFLIKQNAHNRDFWFIDTLDIARTNDEPLTSPDVIPTDDPPAQPTTTPGAAHTGSTPA